MAFEIYPYDRACVASTQRLGITLNKHGQMLMNAATCAALGLPSHVRLLYDRATRTIGVQASGEGERHALLVSSPHGEPRSRRVSAKGFCAYFGLQPYRGRWYRGELRNGMLHVPLGDQLPVGALPLLSPLLPRPDVQRREASRTARRQRRRGLAEL